MVIRRGWPVRWAAPVVSRSNGSPAPSATRTAGWGSSAAKPAGQSPLPPAYGLTRSSAARYGPARRSPGTGEQRRGQRAGRRRRTRAGVQPLVDRRDRAGRRSRARMASASAWSSGRRSCSGDHPGQLAGRPGLTGRPRPGLDRRPHRRRGPAARARRSNGPATPRRRAGGSGCRRIGVLSSVGRRLRWFNEPGPRVNCPYRPRWYASFEPAVIVVRRRDPVRPALPGR